MVDVESTCGSCDARTFYGVRLDGPISERELRVRIAEKLGHDGTYICPGCESLVFVELGGRHIADPQRLRRAQLAQRIGRSARAIRFGVGDPNGAQSAVWRVWMNNRRDDVYIAARGLASQLKVSLHPEFWYYGFTSDFAGRVASLPGGDRKRHVWDRPDEFGPGWTRAFEIVVPGTELVEPPSHYVGSEAVWFPTPDAGEAVHFTVLLSKPDAARGRRGYPSAEGFELTTEFVTRLEMSTGERLWVLAHVAPVADDEKVRLQRVHANFENHAGELLRRAEAKPTFSPRAIVFAESDDGVASFIDVSLEHIVRPARSAG